MLAYVSKLRPGMGFLFGAVPGVLTFLLMAPYSVDRVRAANSQAWPSANGVVVYESIMAHQMPGKNRPAYIEHAVTDQLDKNASSPADTFCAHAIYIFHVGRDEYVGNVLSYEGARCGSLDSVRAWVSAHPVSSPIAVHYYPNDPHTSVVYPNLVDKATYATEFGWLLGVALPFVFFGWLFDVEARRSGTKPDKSSKSM